MTITSEEVFAIFLIGLFICAPLFGLALHPTNLVVTSHLSANTGQNPANYNGSNESYNVLGILGFIVAAGTLWAVGYQAFVANRQVVLLERQTVTNENQTTLMAGQLNAAIASANAAVVAANAAEKAARSDRPWLFIEDVFHDPLKRKEEGTCFNTKLSFRIRNVGQTPAIVTKISARLFWVAEFVSWDVDPAKPITPPTYEASLTPPAMEQETFISYPFEGNLGGRPIGMQADTKIGPNLITNYIEINGFFIRSNAKRTIEGIDNPAIERQAATGRKYCLIVINYLDLGKIECSTSFYWGIGRKGTSPRGVEKGLHEKYNDWK